MESRYRDSHHIYRRSGLYSVKRWFRSTYRYGRYSQEIFRACRLVVDTGIHAFNWTQERAVEYMLKHTASSRAQIEVRNAPVHQGVTAS